MSAWEMHQNEEGNLRFCTPFIYGKRKDLGEGKKELVEVLCNEIAF